MTLPTVPGRWSRRSLLAAGLRGLALASLPSSLLVEPRRSFATEPADGPTVEAVVLAVLSLKYIGSRMSPFFRSTRWALPAPAFQNLPPGGISSTCHGVHELFAGS